LASISSRITDPRRRRFSDQAHRAILARGQADEAIDLAGHANERVHRLAVGDPRQMQRNGKSEARDEREGVRRIDCERRQ
jgi:hypothetical protein